MNWIAALREEGTSPSFRVPTRAKFPVRRSWQTEKETRMDENEQSEAKPVSIQRIEANRRTWRISSAPSGHESQSSRTPRSATTPQSPVTWPMSRIFKKAQSPSMQLRTAVCAADPRALITAVSRPIPSGRNGDFYVHGPNFPRQRAVPRVTGSKDVQFAVRQHRSAPAAKLRGRRIAVTVGDAWRPEIDFQRLLRLRTAINETCSRLGK